MHTTLTAGEVPDKMNALIEISQGSSVKYEIDKETGLLFVDRFTHGAMFYPFNYGYIPGTSAEDGDALDILVISTYAVQPGTVIPSRAIGMLEMEDEAGIDTKKIAVPHHKVDPFYKEVQDISDLPEMVKAKIKNFFDRYKDLEEGKWVKTKDFLSKDKAVEAIKAAMK
jgi:inorganic pyrophosphatase